MPSERTSPKKSEEDIILEKLMQHRTVMLGGEISLQAIVTLTKQLVILQLESSEPIKMIINSGGGGIDAALYLCDFMTHFMTAPIHATAIGSCSSAATFVMMHCQKRQCTPHTRFVIHSGRISKVSFKMDGATEENLLYLLEDSRRTTKMVVELYMRKLDKSQEEIEALIARGDRDFDNSIGAQDAVDIGLIENIVEENIGVFPLPPKEKTEPPKETE